MKGEKRIEVGTSEEIKGTLSTKTKIWDAEGKTIIPGFIGAHQHLSLYGEMYLQEDVGPKMGNSIDDFKGIIRNKAAVTPKDQWIRGQEYDDMKTIDKRFLNKWDLDVVSQDHPI